MPSAVLIVALAVAGWSHHAIAVARGTGGIFSPFPRDPGLTRCGIPRGGPTVVLIRGSCRTIVGLHRRIVVVSFVETWNARAFRGQGSPERGRLSHTWRFFESRRGRILREVTFGDFPPQWVM
jgi:hypothetical protein